MVKNFCYYYFFWRRVRMMHLFHITTLVFIFLPKCHTFSLPFSNSLWVWNAVRNQDKQKNIFFNTGEQERDTVCSAGMKNSIWWETRSDVLIITPVFGYLKFCIGTQKHWVGCSYPTDNVDGCFYIFHYVNEQKSSHGPPTLRKPWLLLSNKDPNFTLATAKFVSILLALASENKN